MNKEMILKGAKAIGKGLVDEKKTIAGIFGGLGIGILTTKVGIEKKEGLLGSKTVFNNDKAAVAGMLGAGALAVGVAVEKAIPVLKKIKDGVEDVL